MSELDEVLQEFLAESREGLARFERDLVALEAQPSNGDLITRLFRVLHTIKGTSGMLGFPQMEKAAHSGENLLALLREGQRTFSAPLATALLQLTDFLMKALRKVQETGSDQGVDPGPIQTMLKDATESSVAPRAAGMGAPGAPTAPAEAFDETLRVNVRVLDHLMDLTSELVLARNQLYACAETIDDSSLTPVAQELNFLTREIQEAVMKARLQPVASIFQMFPRVVRDLATELRKKVRLEIAGADTKMDKGLLEALRDPLTHLVRNCVDHGLEEPEERAASGKGPEGVVRLSARHEAGLIHLEVSDDGRGISLDRIRKTATAKQLVDPAHLASMADEEVLSLIFMPGFTTASQVTRLSGRGVGMDVVRANVERLGGAVEVRTTLGKGTTFHLRLPLTLTIVPSLLVGCAGQRFALPRVHIRELHLLRSDGSRGRIEYLHDAPVYRLRGQVVPVVFLSKELGLRSSREPNGLLVLGEGDKVFVLAVDEIFDFQEIVLKPLASELKPLSVYAGSTIFGDGRVVLILDVVGLAQKAHLVSEAGPAGPVDAEPEAVDDRPKSQVLIFGTPDDGRMAMPLEHVVRLTEFPREKIEHVGDLDVVQFGKEILPLVWISKLLPERRRVPRHPGGVLGVPDKPKVQVVVYSEEGWEVGLVVDRFFDILETHLEVQKPASRKGVLGSMILGDRATELLDIPNVLAAVGAPARKAALEKRKKA